MEIQEVDNVPMNQAVGHITQNSSRE
jgi:hypothetical protein